MIYIYIVFDKRPLDWLFIPWSPITTPVEYILPYMYPDFQQVNVNSTKFYVCYTILLQ